MGPSTVYVYYMYCGCTELWPSGTNGASPLLIQYVGEYTQPLRQSRIDFAKSSSHFLSWALLSPALGEATWDDPEISLYGLKIKFR